MAIYVTFYHLDRTMVGKTEGEITLADLMGYLDDVEKARAVGYAKIFDCSNGQSNLLPAEREVFARRLAAYHTRYGKQAGPFAVVAGLDVQVRMADLQILVTAADTRPVRIFDDIHAARRWVAEQPQAEAAIRSRSRG